LWLPGPLPCHILFSGTVTKLKTFLRDKQMRLMIRLAKASFIAAWILCTTAGEMGMDRTKPKSYTYTQAPSRQEAAPFVSAVQPPARVATRTRTLHCLLASACFALIAFPSETHT
jgi:hypothetical protein